MLHSAEKEKEIYRKVRFFIVGLSIAKAFHLNHIPILRSSHVGFFPADRTKERHRIQVEKSGKRYEIVSITQDDIIVIQDEEHRRKLDQRSCDILNNISSPNSPSISFDIASQPHITLYKCSSHATDPMVDDRFFNSSHCKDFNISYKGSAKKIARENFIVLT